MQLSTYRIRAAPRRVGRHPVVRQGVGLTRVGDGRRLNLFPKGKESQCGKGDGTSFWSGLPFYPALLPPPSCRNGASSLSAIAGKCRAQACPLPSSWRNMFWIFSGFLSALVPRFLASENERMNEKSPDDKLFFSFLFGPHLLPLLHCRSEPSDALWMPEGSPSHIHLQSPKSRPTSCLPCQHFVSPPTPLQKIKIKPAVSKVRLSGNPTSSQIWCSD